MYCEGTGGAGMIRHDDHDRGVSYSYLEGLVREELPTGT